MTFPLRRIAVGISWLAVSILFLGASLAPSPADAQTKALEAIAGLAVARQAMVACHDHLAKDHRRLGFGTFAGPFQDKYPPTTGEHRLRAV